jgi:hypothetical protein
MATDEIWDLEREVWFGGVDTYERHMGPEALVVFPAPGMLERRPSSSRFVRHGDGAA